MNIRESYGISFPKTVTTQIGVELSMIRAAPQVRERAGTTLFHHYREAQTIFWPEDDHHRWSDLMLQSFTKNEITVLMGCSDSCKTYSMARFILVDWWAYPNETLWLISSTEIRGAELRIWGIIKQLFNRARAKFPELPGAVLESAKAITTERISDDQSTARSLQKGLILVPAKRGNVQQGIASFIGVKSPRLRHAGDETAAMPEGFLDAYSNWYGKRDFKGLMSGNISDTLDPLGKAAEPLEGWDSFVDTEKTQEWTSRFFDAHVIALDGRDSPNFDQEGDRYPYIINQKKLDGIIKTYGKDSWKWFSQCTGKPSKSLSHNRVLSPEFCRKHKARDEVVWAGSDKHVWIYALDPAYGGGDRCMCGPIEIGLDLGGKMVVKIYPPKNIPISFKKDSPDPDDQIAIYVRDDLTASNIPIENAFYDSVGKGTLGFAFNRVFGLSAPIPVNSGMQPTVRPVRHDLFVVEPDGKKRHKRCDEEYGKFVSEMWFSVRECVESEQLREMPVDVMMEMSQRTYGRAKQSNAKIDVEPKDDFKDRIGRSCDLGDWMAIAIEGARRRGFKINRLGEDVAPTKKDDWIEKAATKLGKLLKSRQLKTA